MRWHGWHAASAFSSNLLYWLFTNNFHRCNNQQVECVRGLERENEVFLEFCREYEKGQEEEQGREQVQEQEQEQGQEAE